MVEILMSGKTYAERFAKSILDRLHEEHKSKEYDKALKSLQSIINKDSLMKQDFGFDQEPEADAQDSLGGSTEQWNFPIEVACGVAELQVKRLMKAIKRELKKKEES